MLSVVIPFYNAENYIKNCLELLKKQTLKNDFEVIFVNDGSTDNSVTLFNEHNFDKSKIRLINLPKSGVSKARNAGILEARGEYITFFDIDDSFSEDLLFEYHKNIQIHPSEFYIYDYIEQVGDKKSYIKLPNMAKNLSEISSRTIIGFILGEWVETPFFASVWRICISKAFLIKNNIFFKKDIFIAEDMLFYLECFKYIEKIFYVPKALYIYVRRPNSSLNVYRENFIDMQIKLHKYFLDYLKPNVSADSKLANLYSVNKFRCYTALLSNETRSGSKLKVKIGQIKKICNLFSEDKYALKAYDNLSFTYKTIYQIMRFKLSLLLLCIFDFKEKIRLWKLRETS